MSQYAWLGAFATAAALVTATAPVSAQHAHPAPGAAQGAAVAIPEPMRVEHEAIHARLEAATRAPAPVGDAARALAHVLGPHFARENQIALPPLGLLEPLAHGEAIAEEDRTRALALTDSLRAELRGMLEEHVRIAAAARELERVAREHGNAEVAALAHALQLHARTEEAVHYPAAVLVGTLLRHR